MAHESWDDRWHARLVDLARRIRAGTRAALADAAARGGPGALARSVGAGAGDETFGLDAVSESIVTRWLEETASVHPLSFLTEDVGWRHLGPGAGGRAVALPDFDHGGPRIACDPIDGTRNLMHDLRSAWTVLGLAGPGAGVPRLAEVEFGLVAELPDSRAGRTRTFVARRGSGCRLVEEDLAASAPAPATGTPATGSPATERVLRADTDDRPDEGYFSFFSFHPEVRPAVARLALDFFRRLERGHGARLESCLDDQYIASAAQLVLVATGTYRLAVDARGRIPRIGGPATRSAAPYDVSGAVLCAREAGAVVLDLDGEPLDVPLDVTTPVSFCAFPNEATRARLWPELAASLAGWRFE